MKRDKIIPLHLCDGYSGLQWPRLTIQGGCVCGPGCFRTCACVHECVCVCAWVSVLVHVHACACMWACVRVSLHGVCVGACVQCMCVGEFVRVHVWCDCRTVDLLFVQHRWVQESLKSDYLRMNGRLLKLVKSEMVYIWCSVRSHCFVGMLSVRNFTLMCLDCRRYIPIT